MEASALGRTGLGDTAAGPSGVNISDALAAIVLAYGSAVSGPGRRLDLASVYLSLFQDAWSAYSADWKRYVIGTGISAAALASAGIPDTLTADGVLGTNTAKVVAGVLGVSFGAASHDAVINTPTNISGVPVWFATKVVPLAPPADGRWAIWNMTKLASVSDISNNVVGQVVAQAMSGGLHSLLTFTAEPSTTTPTPNTNPGTGTAPVPGGLPTVRPIQTDTIITAGTGQVPTWVWVAGGGVFLGAVVGVGYYLMKKRPDLFRSRAKKRR